MSQKVYEYESHFYIDLKVWEQMLPLYKMLDQDPPPKPVLVLSTTAKENQRWELE